MTQLNRLPEGDATALAALVANGDVTAEELLDAAIAHTESVNPKINAVIYKLYEQARAQIKAGLSGPFAGVPFLIKDLLCDYAGAPIASGSKFLKDYVPDHDAELVTRYKAAGLVIFGKTNTPEFGLNPYTEPTLFGPTRNPWDLARTPGGSSGGTGAAIATGLVPMAGGGDGGGSIRIPASCNGLVGLKPTRGRTPTGPVRGDIWFGAAVEAPLTRSVRDTAAMLDALSAPEAGAPNYAPASDQPFLQAMQQPVGKLRIAVTREPMLSSQMDAECLAGLDHTIKLLESLGHEVVEDAPTIDFSAIVSAFLVMTVSNVSAEIAAASALIGKKPTRGDFEPNTWALKRLGDVTAAPDLALALQTLQIEARKVGRFMEPYDAWLTPTLATPPFEIGALQTTGAKKFGVWALNHLPIAHLAKRSGVLQDMADDVFGFIPNTPIANITGQPSVSLPLHWTASNLPVGMMFTGRFGDEATLLQLSKQLEEAQPWFDRRPELAKF